MSTTQFGPYAVKNVITLGDVPTFFSGSEKAIVQILIENCVLLEGKPVGEAGAMQIPLSYVTKIAAHLVKVAGLGNES